MRYISLIILILINSMLVYGQEKKLFEIKELIIDDSLQFRQSFKFKRADSVFYRDENYIARKLCHGEFGGQVFFKNMKTGIETSCNATCPVIINKFKDKYIITNTLAHLSGFTSILEIDNPDSITFNLPPLQPKKKAKVVSKRNNGTKVLVDSVGILTLGSFQYNDQLYHIITDYKKTYIAQIANHRFVTIDTISNQSLWTYNPELIRTRNDHYVVLFANYEIAGFIDIIDNRINIIRRK